MTYPEEDAMQNQVSLFMIPCGTVVTAGGEHADRGLS